MKKLSASIQHVSIFRINDIYIIGALYDFESDNQEDTLDIIVQGHKVSFWIDEAKGPKKGRTSIATATVHIMSATGPIPAFEVTKNSDNIITVPVFPIKGQDQLKIAGEITSISSTVKQSLSLIPSKSSELPENIAEELGVRGKELLAREWGWRGW